MATIEMFNIYYFIYIFIAVVLTVLSVRLLRNKSDKYRFWFVYGLILLNFAIHFLKILIFPYTDPYFVENRIVKVSFENICAVSVLVFPFLYFVKAKTLKDYMVSIAFVSGLLAVIYPLDAIAQTFNAVDITGIYTKTAFSLETIRFYTTHFLLFLAPFLMLYYKMHEISIKRAIWLPFYLIMWLFIIYLNEYVLSLFGLVPGGLEMYDPNGRNPSLIFGVKDIDNIKGVGLLLKVVVPRFLTVNPFTGTQFFWPVIWMVIPVIIYGYLLAVGVNLVFDHDNTIEYIKTKLRMKIKKEETEQI